MSTDLRTLAPARTTDLDQLAALTDQTRDEGSTEPVSVRIGSREAKLSPAVANALLDVLDRLASGSGVLVSSVDDVVTTGRAASLLGVSRTFVSKLLDAGTIPFEYRGTHRRIRTTDVLAYLDQRRRERTDALDEISRLSRDAGLYNDEF